MKVLVGSSFAEIALDERKCVLLDVWARQCLQTKPHVEMVAEVRRPSVVRAFVCDCCRGWEYG